MIHQTTSSDDMSTRRHGLVPQETPPVSPRWQTPTRDSSLYKAHRTASSFKASVKQDRW